MGIKLLNQCVSFLCLKKACCLMVSCRNFVTGCDTKHAYKTPNVNLVKSSFNLTVNLAVNLNLIGRVSLARETEARGSWGQEVHILHVNV